MHGAAQARALVCRKAIGVSGYRVGGSMAWGAGSSGSRDACFRRVKGCGTPGPAYRKILSNPAEPVNFSSRIPWCRHFASTALA